MTGTAQSLHDSVSKLATSLRTLGIAKTLDRGAALGAGVDDERLVFVEAGAAKLIAKPRPGEEHVLTFHFPGEIVSLLRKRNGDFRLVALTEMRLITIPAKSILDSAQHDPRLLRTVLSGSFEALHHSRTKLLRLGSRSARERVAGFLLSIAERTCDCGGNTCTLNLPMSRKDIGDNLGLTIETVSRQFTELRDVGLIETQGRWTVKLLDIEKLASGSTAAAKGHKIQET